MPVKRAIEKPRKSVIGLTSKTGEARELYKSLFENSHSVMLIINPDNGIILDANSSACSFYQYSREILTTMNVTEINILPPESVYNEMQKAKIEQRNFFRFKHKMAGGDIKDVEVYSSPITLADSKVLYTIVHDITERLLKEKKEKEVQEKLKSAENEIKMLKGILPLCSFCKKIRITDGNWEQVDVYIHQNSQADISHTICPECVEKHYPGYKGRRD